VSWPTVSALQSDFGSAPSEAQAGGRVSGLLRAVSHRQHLLRCLWWW
jgi:hypothetical protein